MRPGGVLALAALVVLDVFLVIALEPNDLRVAFEGEDVGRDPVEEPAVVRDAPSASSRARSVSMSRSLVGSSSRSTLPPDLSTLARCTRLRSPPDRSPMNCCCCAPLKLKRPT